ncbi:T6SS immunity protein Tdi1 domain-containing protein [Listeria sp. ILCC797]|uniref:T6SS immunity protein Tdi1 domain-containing protein n=1 Tax=Listeria sp. ILCC797 TaxID=1918333 RepID=UPI000B5878BF|nr:T6SS immunity protein Tdi1 domain-containing protein [Listeria sp. ILCC797]
MGIYSDFEQVSEVMESTINKYKSHLPKELIEVWKVHGYGTFMGGYLKIINPDDFIPLVEETYLRNKGTIPILTTSMGDIILFEMDENQESYIIMVNYRRGKTKVLASKFSLFTRFLEEEAFKQKAMDWLPYPEAVKEYDEPSYDECFGYVPLLGLGGPEKIDHLDKVKLREHVLLISSLLGPIE